MNLQGSELSNITTNLEEVLTKGDSIVLGITDIIQSIKLPDLGGLINTFSSLLPQNLIEVSETGVYTLLNATELDQIVESGVENIRGIVEAEVNSKLSLLQAGIDQVTDTAQAAASTLTNLGLAVSNLNVDYLNKSLNSFLQIDNIIGADLPNITNIQSSVGSVIDSLDNLSPKQIRDLADPAFYQQVFNETVDTALSFAGSEAVQNAITQIAPSVNIGALTKLAQAGISTFNQPANVDGTPGSFRKLVEIKFNYGEGEGSDADSSKEKSVTGRKLQSGKSCGVDGTNILIGSTVKTSLGTFTAVDKSKTPSSAGLPVVDLYYRDASTVLVKELELNNAGLNKQVVEVIPPGGGSYVAKTLDKRGADYDLY
jgi:hypothetical protein